MDWHEPYLRHLMKYCALEQPTNEKERVRTISRKKGLLYELQSLDHHTLSLNVPS